MMPAGLAVLAALAGTTGLSDPTKTPARDDTGHPVDAAAAAPPSIVILLSDDAGWADPGETVDLADVRTMDVVSLLAELAAWERDMAAPRWRTAEVWQRNLLKKHTMDVVGREAERALP